jgi:hypothetical protein
MIPHRRPERLISESLESAKNGMVGATAEAWQPSMATPHDQSGFVKPQGQPGILLDQVRGR